MSNLSASNLFGQPAEEGAAEGTIRRVDVTERFAIRSENEHRAVDSPGERVADGNDRPRHVAVGVGGSESCYLTQTLPYNNTDWSQPEVGAAFNFLMPGNISGI